jgi:alpha-1,2-mannosyltransferase
MITVIKFFKLTFIAFTLIYSFITLGKIQLKSHLIDFNFFYQASLDVRNRADFYKNINKEGFYYPPSIIPFVFPISFLPQQTAEDIWVLLSYGSLVVSVFLVIKTVSKTFPWVEFMIIYGLSMLSFPVKFSLVLGQINLFVLLGICLCWYFYKRRKLAIAGVMLGLAGAIKITPLLFVLFFLRKREYKLVAISWATFIFLTLLAVPLYGAGWITGYYLGILPHFPTVGNASYYNQSLTGFLARSGVSNQIAGLVNYAVLIFLLVMSFFITKKDKASPEIDLVSFGMFISATIIGSGLAWQHHLVWLIIPFISFWVFLSRQKHKNRWLIFCLILAYFLVAGNVKNPDDFSGPGVSLLLSHGLYGALLLFGIGVAQRLEWLLR